MKKSNLIFSTIIGILIMSCASVKVTSDISSDANFDDVKSYKVVQFVNEDDLNAKKFPTNELNKKRVETAIGNEVKNRSLTSSEEPDVIILWSVNIDLEKSYSTHTTYTGGGYWGYRGRYGGYGMGSSQSTTQEYETIIGILSIAVIDAETEELLWIGKGQKEIKGKSEKAEQNINLVVSKIFEQFPIKITEN